MNNIKTRKSRNFRGWYIVFISAFMGCTISAGFPQFSMTVKPLEQALGISQNILLLGDTVKSAAIVVAMMVAGFAYKKFGARKTFIFTLFATIVPQILIPYFSSEIVFMLLKILQGFSAVIFPVFLILIMDSIDAEDTGFATAIFNGIFYGGAGVGGTFTGFIITQKGWLASYYALGLLELFVGIIWLITVKDNSKQSFIEKDFNINYSEKSNEVVSAKHLLTTPTVWLLVIGFFSTTFVLQAITVDMPIFGTYIGYSDGEIGKAMTAVTIGMIAACLVSGKVSDSFARRKQNKARARIGALIIGPIIIAISSAVLILLDLSNFGVFYGAVLFFSFGAAWGLGTFYCILPEIFDKETLPIVTGFSGGIGDLGMPLAPLIVGVIFGVRGMWNLGWASCVVMAAISIVACLILLKYVRIKSNDIYYNATNIEGDENE